MPAPRRPASISIRHVAELAGVSVGSASRVINQAPNVTADVRERVQRAIAELGYRPNHAAQSLRLKSSRTIGCMLTDVTNPMYGKLFQAMEERFRAAGYVMLLANSLNRPEREVDILHTFRSRGMDGVVIAPGNERHADVLQTVAALDMPTVVLDRDMAPERDRVQFDHVPGMRAVVTHLLGLGHRRIALVLAQAVSRPMRRRIEGWRAAHQAAGVAAHDELLVQLPTGTSPAFSSVQLLLERAQRPTAIIVMGTTMLHETLNAIMAKRLRIPDDISVVSIGDPDFARSHLPPISALRVDVGQVAEQTAAILLDRIEHRDLSAARTVKVEPDFVVRQSCGVVRG